MTGTDSVEARVERLEAHIAGLGGNAGRFTALAMTAVDAQGRAKVSASLSTNVVLDVVGYYR